MARTSRREMKGAPPPPKTAANGPARVLDRKKLALVHIVKKELGLSDRDYRCLLRRAAGVESAKDLDETGFRTLMRFFVRSDYYRANSFGMTLKQKMFIKSLASQLGWEPQHLTNFIHKYYQRPDLDHLNRKEASKLIESLKAIRGHVLAA
jgi:hypothetical protein